MFRTARQRLAILAVSFGAIFGATGCLEYYRAAFDLGFLSGSVVTPLQTQQTCYVNNVLVDCSAIPELTQQ